MAIKDRFSKEWADFMNSKEVIEGQKSVLKLIKVYKDKKREIMDERARSESGQ